MSRLPTPGGDNGTWGDVLNTYLQVSHAADGTLNSGVVGSTQIASGAVGSTQIASGAVGATQIASGAVGATQANLSSLASGMLLSGIASARPAAASGNSGLYYLATDTGSGTIYQSNGTSWTQITSGVLHASRHATGGADPISPTSIGALNATMPENYGAVGNGTTDDTTAVQSAITAGGYVWFSKSYRVTSSLLVDAGTTLYLPAGSSIIKDYSGSGDSNALIRNRSFGTKVSKFKIFGPGKIGASSTSATGGIIALYGDYMGLSDFTLDTYAGGQAITIVGDHNRVHSVTIVNAVAASGNGGIRMAGGVDFIAGSCHVEAGDDALQFAPLPASSSTSMPKDVSISRSGFVGCTGKSGTTRFMSVTIIDTGATGGMTSAVSEIGFLECRGIGSTRGILVENDDSTGNIDGVNFVDCSVDMTGATAANEDVLIQRDNANYSSVGAVRNIEFNGFTLMNPVATATNLNIVGSVEKLRIRDPKIYGCSTSARVIDLSAANDCQITGGVIYMNGTTTGIFASNATSATNLTVDGVQIIDVPATQFGINFNLVTRGVIRGCKFQQVSGSITSKGIRVGSSSTLVNIIDNDFSALSVAVSNRVTNLAADTAIRNNRGYNPIGSVTAPTVPASGTAQTNNTGYDCMVIVNGGTVTVIAVGGTSTGATSGSFLLPANQTITLTYSVAPTWKWFGF